MSDSGQVAAKWASQICEIPAWLPQMLTPDNRPFSVVRFPAYFPSPILRSNVTWEQTPY